MVHGIGVHPDWAQVVKPVRVDMAGLGWNTLSIQMPILPNEAESAEYASLFPDIAPRFKAAENYLQDMGMQEIVIVAHSLGATMSSDDLAGNEHSIKAFVAIGMQSTQADPGINSANSLESINIPVLDLYGSKDLKRVLETADLRAKVSFPGNPDYQQMVTEGAEHFHNGYEDQLVESISDYRAVNQNSRSNLVVTGYAVLYTGEA